MKKLIEMLKKLLGSSKKGFTLIELLVVIGILGVLAAALVATIDPFEQLRKAEDANVKNAAVEFVNANIRYYTTHTKMPWDANTACGATGNLAVTSASGLACLTEMIADSELKPAFTTATGIIAKIYYQGTSNNVVACFQPVSKSQQRDPNTKFNSDGTTGCTTNCYWCSE